MSRISAVRLELIQIVRNYRNNGRNEFKGYVEIIVFMVILLFESR